MTVSEIMKKMVWYSKGNCNDINHFLKVYSYAKIIGECEKLDPDMQMLVETAAIVHDIACPLCREKYGNTNGKYQEQEGPALTREFLKDSGLEKPVIERIAYLVGHHHTPQEADGIDYQILIEADYIVNADENGYTENNIRDTLENIFQTETGKELLNAIYLSRGEN